MQDFERAFPALCFALASGVGKTRLMGPSSAICTWREAMAGYQPELPGVAPETDIAAVIEIARNPAFSTTRYDPADENHQTKRTPTMSQPSLHPQFIVDEANQRQSVILPLDEFEALLEDLADLAAVAERREEPSIAHADLVADLQANGLL